jgi:hypothetical protein
MRLIESFIANTEQFVQQTSGSNVLDFSSTFAPFPSSSTVDVLGSNSRDLDTTDVNPPGVNFMASS